MMGFLKPLRTEKQTYKLIGRLKAGVGDLCNSKLLVVSFLCWNDGSIGREREVDTGVRNQIRLELGQIHIQRAIKPQRS